MDSASVTVAASISPSGASAAMRSKTLRSPAMMAWACWRSVMSVMLARTSPAAPGNGMSRTSVITTCPSRAAVTPLEYCAAARSLAGCAAPAGWRSRRPQQIAQVQSARPGRA